MSSQSERLQSAMEYLMTYGWAILIIAVVLGALFQLGIFNASTFTPKAPPGACHVFRPNGPMTSSFINLQGICNGELPQYAASFSGSGTSNIVVQNTKITSPSGPITLTAWGYSLASDAIPREIVDLVTGAYNCVTHNGFEAYQYYPAIYEGILCSGTTLANVPLRTWFFVAITYNGNAQTNYLGTGGGSLLASTPATLAVTMAVNPNLEIGQSWNTAWKGYIANVQLYNASLSSNEITALYNEGIGGAPIKLNNLVGWWPLNGDAKDYSGNNNNGVPTGISFTSNWESGYSSP